MEVPTYQELLAEVYDHSASNVLHHNQEYEDEVHPEEHHEDELENQHEFQKFGGSRQAVEIQNNIPTYIDKTKLSVTYEKDVQTRVINVDSRFRHNPNEFFPSETTILQVPHTSTNFYYKFVNPIKNVVSVRLSSIEIPNTFYSFSTVKGNIFMRLYYPSGQTSTYYDVTISEGNYIVDSITNTAANNITYELQTKLNSNGLGLTFQVSFNIVTRKLRILEAGSQVFDIDFITNNKFSNRISDWGLGYYLGFRKKTYLGAYSYIGESIVDVLGGTYLFLNIHPDWKVIKHGNTETSELYSFAKILIDTLKNTIIYDNGSNTLTKEFSFDKPETIRHLNVKLTDNYGQEIDLLGQELSFTIELKEVMNTSLYNYYVNQQPESST